MCSVTTCISSRPNQYQLRKMQLQVPGTLSSAEVSMSFKWRLPYRTAVWKTRKWRRGKQEAKPLPEVGRKSAKLDEKVLELE